jgi:hypothetical protein
MSSYDEHTCDQGALEVASARGGNKAIKLRGGFRRKDDLKKRKFVSVLDHEPLTSDLDYWMKKTPEERIDTVEFFLGSNFTPSRDTEKSRA